MYKEFLRKCSTKAQLNSFFSQIPYVIVAQEELSIGEPCIAWVIGSITLVGLECYYFYLGARYIYKL